ncbi:tetratricopeptide repeat protein, partial [Spirulina sp. 06S082]|uniref:tetratricopeptide repeat protein n=1 Tax=Spirulina sp. 06S082 TaxID=3110248 RepID=UPI002B221412
FPEKWAATQNNLASACSDRIRGERADNLEQAISFYELALQVYTREAFPEQWAMTQNNLASAYSDRIRGERADNLEQAISFYELALQVRTREAFPEKWAMTQGNLASALLERFKLTEEVRDLEQAIICYRLAAENTPWESRQTDYLEKAADSQYELGIALTQFGQWYDGLAALEASLQTYRQVKNRLARADALQQIARTHYLMSNFDQARTYFRDALRLYLAEQNAVGEAHCRSGLGRLFMRLNFIDDALQELNQACELYRKLENDTRLEEIQQVYQLAQKVKEKQPL